MVGEILNTVEIVWLPIVLICALIKIILSRQKKEKVEEDVEEEEEEE